MYNNSFSVKVKNLRNNVKNYEFINNSNLIPL